MAAESPFKRATNSTGGRVAIVVETEAARVPAPESGPVVLALEDVSVRFGGVRALDGVSFEIVSGEVCGLIGPNGAGKTTLFDVISGVRRADGGRVRFEGTDVTSWGATRRAHAGMRRTFQRVQTFGWLSVEDNVLAALDWRGGGGGMLADVVAFPTRTRRERERRARVEEVLEQCGLTAVRHDAAGSLPTGLARMVELARALADKPKLLLLDEPTSGLDETEAARLGERISEIRSGDCAVALVEHDVGFVMEQCDRVVVLDLGKVLAVGAPQAIRADPTVRAAYLGDGSDNGEDKGSSTKGEQ
jgi:branched-chain amino acid transport system ATP-binding protein